MGCERLLSDVARKNICFTDAIYTNKANGSVNPKVKTKQSKALNAMGDRDENFSSERLMAPQNKAPSGNVSRKALDLKQ
jgi:hypothetical protein